MKMRGMRNLPTYQTLAHRNKSGSREQAVTELARLEHEKGRLERELRVWTTKQEETERLLSQITVRLEELQQVLSFSAKNSQTEGSRPVALAAPDEEKCSTDGRGWKVMPLEY